MSPLVHAYDARHDLDADAVRLLLGGKAANLSVMAVELGLPVPPAFTITTTACKAFLATGWPAGLDAEVRAAMARLETLVGRRFGDPADPLLVSVRSGAPRSMPGMMDTILNLGLDDATEHGLAATSGDPAFARECHERFKVAYRAITGEDAPSDPWQQLRGAIEAVFHSWRSDRARTYREREGIPEDLGTGVTVQAMVFGNRGEDSGTGVLFTRNPATGEDALYGDVLFDAQGEDVVAGTHATTTIPDLERRMPAVAAELRSYADRLERHYRDCCDIEFTIEQGRLWMLQTRVGKRTPRAALRMAVDMAEEEGFPLTREEAVRRILPLLAEPPTETVGVSGPRPAALTTGLGASPGVVSGVIRLTPDDAIAAAAAGESVILVRADTSPDDVHGMGSSCGILTATGGFASHAAVVARGWGIPAVVGATDVVLGDGSVTIGGRTLAPGDEITIDGATGEVFDGAVDGESHVVPEAAVLLGWARELGIEVAAPGGERDEAAVISNGDPAVAAAITTDAALRVLVVKGYAAADGIATAMRAPAEAAAAVIDALVAEGLAEAAAGSFRLTGAGRTAAQALIAADTASWGAERAVAALDAFLALDHRLKDVVTAWQTRLVDGVQGINDHADAAYDGAVLERLAALHEDAAAWLASLDGVPSRMAAYRSRLDAAAAAAAAGDGRYVASPRVDSYHGVWFELHEDLILLAGRSRADEVAAGRA